MQKFSVLRYCFSETQRLLSTSSRCMMAIWPAGPPKLMKPSFTQNQNASQKPTGLTSIPSYQVNNSASLTTVVQEVKKRFADVASANLGHRPKLSGNRAEMPKG